MCEPMDEVKVRLDKQDEKFEYLLGEAENTRILFNAVITSQKENTIHIRELKELLEVQVKSTEPLVSVVTKIEGNQFAARWVLKHWKVIAVTAVGTVTTISTAWHQGIHHTKDLFK